MNKQHGGDIEGAAKKYNLCREDIIDFSANINFIGPPPQLYQKLQNELKLIEDYPQPNSENLRCRLAQKYGFTADNYILGNGAVELIYLLISVLEPDYSLILAPTFSEYEKALNSKGSDIKYHYLNKSNKFKIDVEKLKKDISQDIDLCILCNPNNPTGNFIDRDTIFNILKYNKKRGIYTIIDEAFVDFMNRDISAVSLLKKYDNLFVLRSLTKIFAIPGLRLGFGIGQKNIINKMYDHKDPWNVNIMAQRAGELLLKQKQYIKHTKISVNKEKKFLYNYLKKYKDLDVYYPNANYIFIDISDLNITAQHLCNKLAKRAILIRDCSNYRGLNNNFIRIAVKKREHNLKFLEQLDRIFHNMK